MRVSRPGKSYTSSLDDEKYYKRTKHNKSTKMLHETFFSFVTSKNEIKHIVLDFFDVYKTTISVVVPIIRNDKK